MKKLILLSFGAALMMMACADLEELAPINSIPSNGAINNAASAQAAVNGLYDEMQDGTLVFDGYLALPQFFSDEADATGTFPTRLEFGNLNVFPANGTMAAVFTDFYDAINVANGIEALVPGVEDAAFTDAKKNDFVAQARMMRAFCYMQLTAMWQEVPLITEPTTAVGDVLNVAKSSQADIYAQIIADLMYAEANLIAATGPTQASVQAAQALLARTYLYQGNYPMAKTKALDALGGATFDLTGVGYLQDQIYTLGFTPSDGNTLNFFYAPADLNGRYSIGPSTKLINSFEAGDIRRDATVNTVSAGVPFGVKYPSFSAGISGAATDPLFFVRHSEMVLIIAEADAEAGAFGDASGWINQVRTRAGLADITLDAMNYVDAILQERFVEFAFEGNQRLVDLRRRGKAMEVLGPIGYDACDDVWPLPQRDVDRNINLMQNTCCNC